MYSLNSFPQYLLSLHPLLSLPNSFISLQYLLSFSISSPSFFHYISLYFFLFLFLLSLHSIILFSPKYLHFFTLFFPFHSLYFFILLALLSLPFLFPFLHSFLLFSSQSHNTLSSSSYV